MAVERGAIVALDPSIRPRAGAVPELLEMIERLTQRVEHIERRLPPENDEQSSGN